MFSKLVKLEMIQQDISREELARRLGCSSSNLSQILRVDNFREETMVKFAKALGKEIKIDLL